MKIKVTKELCEQYGFVNTQSCALFHAIENSGLPIHYLAISHWIDKEGFEHSLTPGFHEADYLAVLDTGIPFEVDV